MSGDADTSGYYEPHATLALARPLAIAGFCGAGVELVARSISARTGLGFTSTDRALEHALGLSLSLALATWGVAAIRDHERRILQRLVDARPPQVIALGESALVDPATRALVHERATLVYLEATPAELLARILDARRRDPGRFMHVLPLELEGVDTLAPLLAEREPGYRVAHHVLPLRGRHPHRLAEAIVELVAPS